MALENNQIENSIIDNDEISLKELIVKIKEWFSFLKSKWKTIFFIGIIGGLIGLTIALFEKPIYKASLTFAMEEDKGGGVGGGLTGALGLASNLGFDLGGSGVGGAFAASNLGELMKSRLVVERVLLKSFQISNKKITLIEYYIEINKLRENWKKDTALFNIHFLPYADRSKFTLQQDSLLKAIRKDLIDKGRLSIMQKDKKVTILTIEVNSENEFFSKYFCENLAKETSDFYIKTKSKKARINVDVLQKQVDSVKYELNSAITGVASEVDLVYNLNPAYNTKSSESKKRQVDVQANTEILKNLAVQLELAKITLRKETPLIQLIDEPSFPLEKSKFGKLKSIILGGFLTGLFYVLYLILGRIYKNIIQNEN